MYVHQMSRTNQSVCICKAESVNALIAFNWACTFIECIEYHTNTSSIACIAHTHTIQQLGSFGRLFAFFRSHKISNQPAIYTYFLHITYFKYNFPIALCVCVCTLPCIHYSVQKKKLTLLNDMPSSRLVWRKRWW